MRDSFNLHIYTLFDMHFVGAFLFFYCIFPEKKTAILIDVFFMSPVVRQSVQYGSTVRCYGSSDSSDKPESVLCLFFWNSRNHRSSSSNSSSSSSSSSSKNSMN